MDDNQYGTQQLSSWDNKGLSTSFYPSRYQQHVSSIPTSPAPNYAGPYSRYSSQNPSQYNIDGRQIQQSKHQSKSTDIFQPMQTNNSKTSNTEWCEEHISATQVLGLLLGLIITGVPLAVIVTLYVQLPSSSTSSNTTTTTGPSSTISTSISLPSQCISYNTLSDYYRVTTYTVLCGSGICDSSMNAWYRVTGAAGSQLATSPVNTGGCGTYYPAWFNGTLPTTPGFTTSGVACVNLNGNLCYLGYSGPVVLATNCNGFYVFYLTSLSCPCCSCFYYPRYCTE